VISVTIGNAQVVIDGLSDIAQEVIDRVAPGVRDRFESAARDVLAESEPYWPRYTGDSRRNFRIRTSLTANSFKTLITNSQRYVWYARFKFPMHTQAEVGEAVRSRDEMLYRRYVAWTGKFSDVEQDEAIESLTLAKRARRYDRKGGVYGCPKPEWIGRGIVSQLLRKPARRAEKRLAEELEQELLRAAGG